jgi:hypothetical protein
LPLATFLPRLRRSLPFHRACGAHSFWPRLRR